jgi:hypothetical protein
MPMHMHMHAWRSWVRPASIARVPESYQIWIEIIADSLSITLYSEPAVASIENANILILPVLLIVEYIAGNSSTQK